MSLNYPLHIQRGRRKKKLLLCQTKSLLLLLFPLQHLPTDYVFCQSAFQKPFIHAILRYFCKLLLVLICQLFLRLVMTSYKTNNTRKLGILMDFWKVTIHFIFGHFNYVSHSLVPKICCFLIEWIRTHL